MGSVNKEQLASKQIGKVGQFLEGSSTSSSSSFKFSDIKPIWNRGKGGLQQIIWRLHLVFNLIYIWPKGFIISPLYLLFIARIPATTFLLLGRQQQFYLVLPRIQNRLFYQIAKYDQKKSNFCVLILTCLQRKYIHEYNTEKM